MLSGLMMDYPLTVDRILEHGNRLYPYKQIKTKLPDGAILAEETPTLDGGNVRRIIADGPPAAEATQLEAQLQDGYLRLITHGRSELASAEEDVR